MDSLRQDEGCSLCKFLSRQEYTHLVCLGTSSLNYGRSQPPGMGLCNWHFWELRRAFWGPHLAKLLVDMLASMPAGLDLEAVAVGLGDTLPLDSARCAICLRLANEEAACAGAFAAGLREHSYRELFEQSRGLCLPHFHAVASAMDLEARSWLIHTEHRHWERMKFDLAENIRKAQPPLRAQLTVSEETAPGRCIQKLVGRHGRIWPMGERSRE